MTRLRAVWLSVVFAVPAAAVAQTTGPTSRPVSPADHLPPYLRQVTWFGERADWSHDGRRLLFLSKTYGDAMELDVASGRVRNLTAHFPHHGYTRALYLANGDVLLSGPERYDPRHVGDAREQCVLSVLDRSLAHPARPLGTKCFEGPAVSRRRMHLAWTHVAAEYPDELPAGGSRMQEADLVIDPDGRPRLAGRRVVLDARDLPFRCTLETQNFVPPDENRLTFSAYGHQGTDVCCVDLTTRRVTNLSDAPGQYDEPEGVFPDGRHTLVECDRHNHRGPGHVDLWRLATDGSRTYDRRYTRFSDTPGYKASNPVVSDDGRWIAFQLATPAEAAGVGHGLFVLDVAAADPQAAADAR